MLKMPLLYGLSVRRNLAIRCPSRLADVWFLLEKLGVEFDGIEGAEGREGEYGCFIAERFGAAPAKDENGSGTGRFWRRLVALRGNLGIRPSTGYGTGEPRRRLG